MTARRWIIYGTLFYVIGFVAIGFGAGTIYGMSRVRCATATVPPWVIDESMRRVEVEL